MPRHVAMNPVGVHHLLTEATGTSSVAVIDCNVDGERNSQDCYCIVLYRLPAGPMNRPPLTLRSTLRYDTSYPVQGYGKVEVFTDAGWRELWTIRGEHLTDATSHGFCEQKQNGGEFDTYTEWLHSAYVADLKRLNRAALAVLDRT